MWYCGSERGGRSRLQSLRSTSRGTQRLPPNPAAIAAASHLNRRPRGGARLLFHNHNTQDAKDSKTTEKKLNKSRRNSPFVRQRGRGVTETEAPSGERRRGGDDWSNSAIGGLEAKGGTAALYFSVSAKKNLNFHVLETYRDAKKQYSI